MADLDVTIPDALLPCPCCQEPMHLGAGYDGDPMWEHPVRAGEDAMCPLGVVTMYAWDEPSIALWNRRSPPPDKDRIAASGERGSVTPADVPPADLLIEYPNGSLGAMMFHFATEGDDLSAIARDAGFDFKSFYMDGDDDELTAAWLEDEGEHTAELLRRWKPAAPEGYHIAGKWDTEDGPIALFVRQVKP